MAWSVFFPGEDGPDGRDETLVDGLGLDWDTEDLDPEYELIEGLRFMAPPLR